jgi:hypothetical protein
MSALPERPALAWRTITSGLRGLQITSTVISDANKTRLLAEVTVYSSSIEVADISVLDIPTDTQPGTVWIGDERIEYWMVRSDPTALLPNRGFLEQLLRGTYITPVGNVSVSYDTIFYDGNGIETYFATATGTTLLGGNVAVYIGDQIQVDTSINQQVGSYTIVDNPLGLSAGRYVNFTSAPITGWRNVRLASPRAEVTFGSQISHKTGSTVIAAGNSQTIPGGYRWIPTPDGMQYSSDSEAVFLINHPGTRS